MKQQQNILGGLSQTELQYGLRSNNTILLTPLAIITLPTLGDRAFAAAAPRLWNSLPIDMRGAQS